MKPARVQLGSVSTAVDGVTIVRRDVDEPARRRELERLLRALLDKPDNPEEGQRP